MQFPLHSFAVVRSCIVVIIGASFAQIGVSITFAPPALPVYEQPLCPGEGYIWTPGYWAYDYDDGDYYWVPGTWVLAPEVGFLWTPGYWGWGGDGFIFHEGYWGPQVGFYGGISLRLRLLRRGLRRWTLGQRPLLLQPFGEQRERHQNSQRLQHNGDQQHTVNRVSYNGGNGGINRRPTPQEEAVAHERHIPPVAVQTQHVQAARTNRSCVLP